MPLAQQLLTKRCFFIYHKRKWQADQGYILDLVGQDNRKYGNTNILELKYIYLVRIRDIFIHWHASL